MGWYWQWGTIGDVVQNLGQSSEHREVLAKALRGRVLWTVEGRPGCPPEERYIGCYLLNRTKDEAGYKPMDESCGPYDYSCPLKYLKMVPTVADIAWRQKVFQWHARRTVKVQVGKVYMLVNTKMPTSVRVSRARGMMVYGESWRVPKRYLVVIPDSARTEQVLALARSIVANKALDRLPILADAIEDTGYDDESHLSILRQPENPNAVRVLAAVLDNHNILREFA